MMGSHVVHATGQRNIALLYFKKEKKKHITHNTVAHLQEVRCQVHEVPDAEPPPGAVLQHCAHFDVDEWSHAQQC